MFLFLIIDMYWCSPWRFFVNSKVIPATSAYSLFFSQWRLTMPCISTYLGVRLRVPKIMWCYPLVSSLRTTMRKTIFCMWPTVTRVSMGSEWWKPSRWEHLDSGVGGGVCVGLGEREGGLPPWRRQKGKTSGNTTPHTPSSYFHTLNWYFLLLPRPREKACQDRDVGLALIEEWRRFNFATFLWIDFCVISRKSQEVGKLGPEMIADHQ